MEGFRGFLGFCAEGQEDCRKNEFKIRAICVIRFIGDSAFLSASRMIRMEGFRGFFGHLLFMWCQVFPPDTTGANLLGFSFAKQRNYPIRPRSKRRLVGKPLVNPRKRKRALAIGGAGAKCAPGGHKNIGVKLRFA
jgi:hypothetical protein